MAVTTIEELRKYADGSEVELPGFTPEQPFVVRLRRPSLVELIVEGEIPNPLLGSAAKLFQDGVSQSLGYDGEQFRQTAEVLMQVAKACLVAPTFEEIKAAGLCLTDLQLYSIYGFMQTGVNALANFRTGQGGKSGDSHGRAVSKAAE